MLNSWNSSWYLDDSAGNGYAVWGVYVVNSPILETASEVRWDGRCWHKRVRLLVPCPICAVPRWVYSFHYRNFPNVPCYSCANRLKMRTINRGLARIREEKIKKLLVCFRCGNKV